MPECQKVPESEARWPQATGTHDGDGRFAGGRRCFGRSVIYGFGCERRLKSGRRSLVEIERRSFGEIDGVGDSRGFGGDVCCGGSRCRIDTGTGCGGNELIEAAVQHTFH
jgi:hypothetical protein